MSKIKFDIQGTRRPKSNQKYIVQVATLLALMIGVYYYRKTPDTIVISKKNKDKVAVDVYKEDPKDLKYPPTEKYAFVPEGSHGQIVHHKYYSLSYNEHHEQAEWVAYELLAINLKKPNVKYDKFFNEDSAIQTKSSMHNDYSNSGYTRGHLAPAGDMNFDLTAIMECYFMSNMSPQIRPFNNGVWKELEEQTRDWAFQKDRLYIVTGPVLDESLNMQIGKNKVSVPTRFYKALLHIDEKGVASSIAFLLPHEICIKHLFDYAITVDELEKVINLNLYSNLLDDATEKMIEERIDKSKWPISEARYKMRVNEWNYQK